MPCFMRVPARALAVGPAAEVVHVLGDVDELAKYMRSLCQETQSSHLVSTGCGEAPELPAFCFRSEGVV